MVAAAAKPVPVEYHASPTITRFHEDPSFVRGIRGPLGAGKSVGCCWEIMLKAHQMTPCRDGVRRSRWVVIRGTYAELKSTTIQTWDDWFGHLAPIVFDAPIRQNIRIHYPPEEGAPVELEVWFLAMDRPRDIKKLKSLEVTGGWLNEAAELSRHTLDMLTGRVGRYPAAKDKPPGCPQSAWPSWSGVVMDTNSVDTDHWWYKLAVVEKPKGFAFFDQPGGFDEKAENLANLPGGRNYYTRMAQGKEGDWIRVFIDNEYGFVQDGKPIYPEFSHRLHVAEQPLAVMRGLPLRLGFDFGSTPACTAMQLTPRGQLRILREWVVDIDVGVMGIEQFAETVVIPQLQNEFAGLELLVKCDPAGETGSEVDRRTPIQALRGLSLPAEKAAATNAWTPRRNALAHHMTRLVDGEPGLVIDPRCTWLIKGLNGAYKYRRLQLVGEERYTDEPDKNKYSHVCEAAQYGAMGTVANAAEQQNAEAIRRARAAAAQMQRHRRHYGY